MFAQDDLEKFQPIMKTAAGANGALRKAVAAGETAEATAKAKEMSEAFDKIAAFFTAKGKDDGVKFAEAASAAGKAIAAGTTKEEQQAAVAKLGPTCAGCHAVYRDGNKFKGM